MPQIVRATGLKDATAINIRSESNKELKAGGAGALAVLMCAAPPSA